MQKSVLERQDKKILLCAIQNRQKYLIEKFSACIASINKIIQDPYAWHYFNEQDARMGLIITTSPKSPSKDLSDYQDNVQQLIKLSKAMCYVPNEMLSVEEKKNSQQLRSLNRSQKKFALLKLFEERLSMYRGEAHYQVDSLFLPLNLSFMLSCLLYFSVLAMSDPDSTLFNGNPYAYASGFSTALAVLIWKVCSIVERYKSLKEKVSSHEEKIDKINKLNSGLSSAFIMLRDSQSRISDDQADTPSQGPQLK